METTYDIIIIGGGPAGLSAAIYASRYNLKVIVISGFFGGQIAESIEVENYPGTERSSGRHMMDAWKKHASLFGAEFKQGMVTEISRADSCFKVKTSKEEFKSRCVLYATGAEHKKLGVKGEDDFYGRGVSYCPTCDGRFFKEKPVAIIGGGDAALRGAQVMTQIASKVYLIHRRDEFRAEPMLVDMIKRDPKIELLLKRNLKEIKGDKSVSSILLDDGKEIAVDAVFIEIGTTARIEVAEKLGVEIEDGLIKANPNQSTNIEGFYAAGDITNGSNKFRQVVTAASEGAIAAESIFEYIKDKQHCAY